MSRAHSISARKTYGVQRVCRNWRIARSSVYHARKHSEADASSDTPTPPPRKRGPRGACTDEQLLEHIERVLVERPFVSEGYRKVWAVLRFEGIRVGHERVLRVMRENDLLAPASSERSKKTCCGSNGSARSRNFDWPSSNSRTRTTPNGSSNATATKPPINVTPS